MTEKMAKIEERALARLMVPDALMPGQYYEGVRRDDPAIGAIKRLMLAVLEDALRCLQTYAKARTPIRRRMFVEAQAWISDRTARGPFAFEAVREALGIEPNRLRDGIREWSLRLSGGMNSDPSDAAFGREKRGSVRLPVAPRTTAHERERPRSAVILFKRRPCGRRHQRMSVVRLQQKGYQIEDRAMEGYATAYRAYLARRDLPGPEPTFADFVTIRKMQERIEGLAPEDLPAL